MKKKPVIMKKKPVMKSLVIVESPAKCRTIEKILGKTYDIQASMGHVIDLPKSKMGVDIDNGFEPKYIVVQGKKKILTALKKHVQGKTDLFLACDPDREGEAIAWHLSNYLGDGIRVHRVIFNEITPQAIRDAFAHPQGINIKKVGAQQARRILDRLVGYSLSPLLWKKVARGLSAGRVQSVALRIVLDRERRIKAFVSEEYWTIVARLKKRDTGEEFEATLEKKGAEKVRMATGDEARSIAREIHGSEFRVKDIRLTHRKRYPQPPFTTSKLQQEAYNRLGLRPARTMRVAQELYEGVALGGGERVGLITYMRTDSVSVAQSALSEVRSFIVKRFGKTSLPDAPNFYKAKKTAQEAHEAIRPTSVHRTPDSVRSYLKGDEFELYSLIWSRFVASQMMPARIRQMTVDILAGLYLFKATGSLIEFPGFLAVMGEKQDEKTQLPPLAKNEKLALVRLKEEQHFTKPPPRFTDASLVKELEEKGIGRPSTYAPIIQTIVGRDYIERQGGSLVPTELGTLVVDLLVQYFPKLMSVGFTATMEEDLDRIEEGRRPWVSVLKEFYQGFSKNLSQAQESIASFKKLEVQTKEVCELCGKPMVVKWGRRGKFLSCSDFPRCRNAKSIPTEVQCPGCRKGFLVARRGRGGRGRKFYGCTRYPECKFITNRLPAGETASS